MNNDTLPEVQFGSLRIAWLEAFVLTVDGNKRTAAAEEMGIKQAAVTKHITKLECWFGGGPRRLLMWPNMWPPTLTDEGKAFLPDARKVLALLRTAKPEPVRTEPAAPIISPKLLQTPKPRPSEA